jgi:hypothetical protein
MAAIILGRVATSAAGKNDLGVNRWLSLFINTLVAN